MDASLLPLFATFIACAAVTLLSGIILAKTTDTLDYRFHLGDALGGMILLGVSGSLPEIAIVFSAAHDGHTAIIAGTLLGGLAIQTLVIVFFDLAVKNQRPFSYVAGSPLLALEICFTIIIALIALAGTFIPAHQNFYGINPLSPVILLAWIAGLCVINQVRKHPRWDQIAADTEPGRRRHQHRAQPNHPFYAHQSTPRILLTFSAACLLTLAAGMVLEKTGSDLAGIIGIDSSIFAATALALVAALPEISTGLESILIGDNHLAVSDVMGGNAFMLTLFFFTDLIAHQPVLSYAGPTDILLALLGIVMMAVYAASFLLRLRRRYFRLGLDSLLEIVLYFSGIYAISFIR